MLKYLFLNQLKQLGRYFHKKTLAKAITVFLFFSIFTLIAFGIYLFFVEGFTYLSYEDQVLFPMLLYFYEIFFLILGGIIFFSAIVTGMFSLWRGKNDDWFVSSANYKYLPKLIFVKCIFSGLWPLFIVVLPTVLALDKVFELSLFAILSIIISFVLFLVFISSLALLLILITGYLYHKASQKLQIIELSFGKFFFLLIFIILTCSYFIWNNSINIDFIDLFKANSQEIESVEIDAIANNYLYLPSHLIAMNTLVSQIGIFSSMIKYLFLLFLFSFVSISLWWKISSLYLPLWQKFKEGGRVEADKKGRKKMGIINFNFKGSSSLALFKREFLVYIRNPRNLIWFSFLLFIWLMQASINFTLSRTLSINDIAPSLKQTAIQAIQFVVATYFISAFVLRFVFPSFSSERKTLWILTSAPIDTRKIFYIKYLFFASFFLILGLGLGYVNLAGLNLDWIYIGETLLLFSVATLFITAIGLSLGAIFPNYETDDPGVISTTMSGLLLIVLSLSYGTLGGLMIYFFQSTQNHLPIYLYIFFSLVIIAGILYFTPKITKVGNKMRNMVS